MVNYTRTRPEIAILANCTHSVLAETLRRSDLFDRVDSFELYSMEEAGYAPLAASLEAYDAVLSLQHGPRFGPLATDALRERLGARFVTAPVPFFSGWQPDMAYLTDRGSFSRAETILGDYHSALLIHDLQSGLTDDEIVARYVSGESFDLLDLEGFWKAGLDELRARERDADLFVSHWIETHRDAPQPFLSFNHPRENLVAHMAGDFAGRVLDRPQTIAPLPPSDFVLYRDAFWPVHREVARRLDLVPSEDARFKAPARFGDARLSIADFARRSLQFYHASGSDGLKVITPAYLPDYIGAKAKAPRPKEVPTNPPSEIVLTHFGRSGSTVLTRLLEQHSRIVWLNEIFSLIWIRTPEKYNFNPGQLMNIVAKERGHALTAKPGAIVGHEIKLMNFLQNPSANMVDYVARLTDPGRYAHVVLRRRNVLRRIFSVYKAMKTKVYHVESGRADHATRTYHVDMNNLFDADTGQTASTLPELIDKALTREEQVLANYRNLGITYFELSYEDDIEADPQRAYAKMIDFFGLPQEPAQITLARTSASLAKEVENWDEVRAALSGTRHEWMFGEAVVDQSAR